MFTKSPKSASIGHSIQFQCSHLDVINMWLTKSSLIGSILKPDLYMNYLCDRENAWYILVHAQKNELFINLLPKGQIELLHVDSENLTNSPITHYLINI